MSAMSSRQMAPFGHTIFFGFGQDNRSFHSITVVVIYTHILCNFRERNINNASSEQRIVPN